VTPRLELPDANEQQYQTHSRNGTAVKVDVSEFGLAYADTTDNLDAEKQKKAQPKVRQKKLPPPPLNLPNIPGQVQFPLLSPKVDLQNTKNSSIASSKGSKPPGRDSTSETAGRTLGSAQVNVNQRGPSSPGLVKGNRVTSASSANSAGSGSVYSKSTGTATGGPGLGGLDRTMATLVEDIANELGPRSALGSSLAPGSALTKSKSASALASAGATSSTNGPSKTQRANTISSPETKAPKLPIRAVTSPTQRDSSRTRDGGIEKGAGGARERVPSSEKKVSEKRVCVRCDNTLVDRRWVEMDGGSVLCEKCWKNMYLPKVGFILLMLHPAVLTSLSVPPM
jgi:hypothetical protein